MASCKIRVMERPQLLPHELHMTSIWKEFPVVLHIELLSWLPVKSLVRFRRVSKSWESLISGSQFVKQHLHRSISRSTDFAHTRLLIKCHCNLGRRYISSRTVTSLLESPSAIAAGRSCIPGYQYIGTCNGLISMSNVKYDESESKYFSQVCFWNPATSEISQDSPRLYCNGAFGFGYDCSSDTYKVVGVRVTKEATMVNVYKMGDNCWRAIQVSPLPLMMMGGTAVYVSNTLNWLAILPSNATTGRYFIVSFDLKEEHPQQFSLPYSTQGRKEFEPILGVLRSCLCISQNSKETHNFVLWQMTKFGDHQSWTQLFNIIVDEKILQLPCFAVCVSEIGDALLFARFGVSQAVIYNQRDNKLEDTKISNDIVSFDAKNYIESLVSPS